MKPVGPASAYSGLLIRAQIDIQVGRSNDSEGLGRKKHGQLWNIRQK